MGAEGRAAITGALAHPAPLFLVNVSWFCLQHQCVKAMDHIWVKRTLIILFHYFPDSLEAERWSWDRVLDNESKR